MTRAPVRSIGAERAPGGLAGREDDELCPIEIEVASLDGEEQAGAPTFLQPQVSARERNSRGQQRPVSRVPCFMIEAMRCQVEHAERLLQG